VGTKPTTLRYICTVVKSVTAARVGILAKTLNLQQQLAETRRNTQAAHSRAKILRETQKPGSDMSSQVSHTVYSIK